MDVVGPEPELESLACVATVLGELDGVAVGGGVRASPEESYPCRTSGALVPLQVQREDRATAVFVSRSG
jgi:hypothetical protein